MTASLTDRYVAATVSGLDEAQRPEVERELHATIEDMVDARLEAGAPTRADAERAVLVELGDPLRLAAGYSGRPVPTTWLTGTRRPLLCRLGHCLGFGHDDESGPRTAHPAVRLRGLRAARGD